MVSHEEDRVVVVIDGLVVVDDRRSAKLKIVITYFLEPLEIGVLVVGEVVHQLVVAGIVAGNRVGHVVFVVDWGPGIVVEHQVVHVELGSIIVDIDTLGHAVAAPCGHNQQGQHPCQRDFY